MTLENVRKSSVLNGNREWEGEQGRGFKSPRYLSLNHLSVVGFPLRRENRA